MSLLRINNLIMKKIRPLLKKRQISTSKKNEDTPAVLDTSKFTKIDEKNWVSYGFERRNKEVDRLTTHICMFLGISVCLVGGTFAMMYAPDVNLKDWAQREAFIQLRYREENHLPLIDPNLLDPKLITLPTDEELGDTDIII